MSLRLKSSTILNGKTGSLLDQAIVSGSHFFISIVLARYLGVETFGWFALGWMVLLFASSIQQAFIITPMLSLFPKLNSIEASNDYLNGLKLIQLLTLLITLIISFISFYSNSIFQFVAIPSTTYWLFVAITFFYLCHDFIRKKFYSKTDTLSPLVLDSIAYAPQIVAIFILAISGHLTLTNSLVSILAGYGIAIFLFAKALIPNSFSLYIFKSTLNKHWIYSKWLIGKSILQWWSGNYFILAAGAILGASALGFIRMAQTLIGLLNVLFLAFENFLPVQAAQQFKQGGIANMQAYLIGFTKKYGLLVLAGLLFVFAFAGFFGNLIFNESDATLAYLIRGYCILYIIVFIAIPLRIFIRTIEKTNILFWAYLLGTVFSMLAANYFINQFAYAGVIAGIIINQIILVLFYFGAITFNSNNNKEKLTESITINHS